MLINQPSEYPQGVKVFGSATMRVDPDIAAIQFNVANTDADPRKSFEKTRQDTRRVRDYLQKSGVDDVQSSRITLTEATKYIDGEHKFLGYRALMSYQIFLRDLDRLEEILTGLVDAGVRTIGNVEFQTSKLKEVRAEARRLAVAAAHEKAALYCEAAGTKVGKVLYIEDQNPDRLQGRESVGGHYDPGISAVEPGKIVVAGAVVIVYALTE